MTGKDFKSKAVAAFGTFKWQKLMAKYLGCHTCTVWRYAQSAIVPEHIVEKIKTLKPMKE